MYAAILLLAQVGQVEARPHDNDAAAALALAARVTELENRVAALESRQTPRGPVAGPYPSQGQTFGYPVQYAPQYAPQYAQYGAPMFYGDAGACGPGGCGPAAGGYRFAPFNGRFRR